MTALEVVYQRLRCREANEEIRVEFSAETRFWRASLDIPGGWGVDGRYRRPGLLKGLDDRGEGLSDLTGEAEA